MDMNLLAKPQARDILNQLRYTKVNNKAVYYEMICGFDYRFLDQDYADAIKAARFVDVRIAWDWGFSEQKNIKKSIDMLLKAGFNSKTLYVFMVCNRKIHYYECLKKLDLLKIWRVKVNDCWYDNQNMPNVEPRFWTKQQIKDFRARCRKHNQMVLFGIDPEIA